MYKRHLVYRPWVPFISTLEKRPTHKTFRDTKQTEELSTKGEKQKKMEGSNTNHRHHVSLFILLIYLSAPILIRVHRYLVVESISSGQPSTVGEKEEEIHRSPDERAHGLQWTTSPTRHASFHLMLDPDDCIRRVKGRMWTLPATGFRAICVCTRCGV